MQPQDKNAKTHRLGSAVKWAFVMNWGPNLIALLLTFVLAAKLGKEAYGLVGTALLYIAFVQIFLEGGLGAAIVQRQNLEPEHLDAVFWITLGFSLSLTALTWLVSPLLEHLYHMEHLSKVLRFESLVLPLQGLTVVQESLLEKKLDFKSLAVRSNLSTMFGGIFGLTLALTGFGVWALVWEDVLAALARVALLWRLGDWRPRLRFSIPHIKDLSGFSLHVLVAQIGTYVQRRSDALLIGVFFGEAAVGIYQMGDRLINLIIDMATRPFILVVLPHFARLQHDIVELRRSVLQCLKTAAMLTVPILAVLAGCSLLFCNALSARGKDWTPAVHVIQILAIVGAARAVTLMTGPLMQSVNRPRAFMIMSWSLAALSTCSFLVAGLWLEHHANMEHQAMGVAAIRATVFSFVYLPICFWIIASIIRTSIMQIIRVLLPAILTSAIVVLLGWGVTTLIDTYLTNTQIPGPFWLSRLVQLALGGGFTGLVAVTLMTVLDPGVREFAMRRLGKGRSLPKPKPVADVRQVDASISETNIAETTAGTA